MKFPLIVVIVLGLIALCSYTVIRVFKATGLVRSGVTETIALIIVIGLPIILIATMVISSKLYSPLVNFFYIPAATWLPFLLYLFIGAVVLGLLLFANTAWNLNLPMLHLSCLVIIIVSGIITYGIINARQPRITTFEINSPSLSASWSGKTIVLVSDTHLGIVRQSKFMDQVVSHIESANPDVVLIAGDIIDGPVFNYQKGLAPLSRLSEKIPVIFTPGNHEAYNSEPDKFYPVIKNLTTTLIDQKIELHNTNIIGIDYRAQETKEEITHRLRQSGFDKNIPSIVILHDPTNAEVLAEAGVSLVVSGHTHCGQFWPITHIVKSLYKSHTHGVTYHDNGVQITTCGVGTAMPPVRIGTHPEIVVIKVK